ncbi:MAG: ABC transporter permease [Acidaminobacteraceae bacterium]
MNSIDLIAMGVNNLLKRKARTILTVLGVIVGTASIVVMLSLGLGMSKSFEEQLQNFGSLNTIEVSSKAEYYGGEEEGDISNGKVGILDDVGVIDIEAIKGVEAVMPMMSDWMQIYSGKYASDINITGIDFSKLDKFEYKVARGVMPRADGKYEMMFGSTIEEQFYNPRSRDRYSNPITVDLLESKVMLIADRNYDPSGAKPRGININAMAILEKTNDQNDWSAFIDIKQLEKLKTEAKRKSTNKDNNDRDNNNNSKDKYTSFKVKVEDVKKVMEVQTKIKEMGFQAYSLADGLEYMENATKGIKATLGGIGAVSLFVAALGITNTMVMSIYERTKEIGVMKVLGAELKDIRRLFLFEAGMIGFFGGVIGLILSIGISEIINAVGMNITTVGYGGESSTISYIPLWLSGLSIVFSTVVGIIAGFYPANRAMNLSALEAIRTE